MFSNKEVLETIAMVEKEHLDIRTITMGISLLSCIRDSAEETAQKVYDLVCKKAENIVKTAEQLSGEYGIPIVNKRVSVTPVSLLTANYPEKSPLVGKGLFSARTQIDGKLRTHFHQNNPRSVGNDRSSLRFGERRLDEIGHQHGSGENAWRSIQRSGASHQR